MAKLFAFTLVSMMLASCGNAKAERTAIEQLSESDLPFETWKLSVASTEKITSGLNVCLQVIDESDTSQTEQLAELGWKSQSYPTDMIKLFDEAYEELIRSGKSDQAQRFNKEQWPFLFANKDSEVFLAVKQYDRGVTCSIIAKLPDENIDYITTAVSGLEPPFDRTRRETPHGFSWSDGDTKIVEDWGDGTGGRYRFFPPVFEDSAPQLVVYKCKEYC